MRRAAHLLFWVAQPAGAVAIGLGLLGVAVGRWLLHREAELRGPAALLLLALAACSMNKSAERQDSFGQQAASRVEEGPVRVVETVEEFQPAVPGVRGPGETRSLSTPPPAILRRVVTVTDRAPVVSTTTASTEASGEAHSASAARFGWSPIAWVIGGLALLVGLWGLFRLKGKLGV